MYLGFDYLALVGAVEFSFYFWWVGPSPRCYAYETDANEDENRWFQRRRICQYVRPVDEPFVWISENSIASGKVAQ